MANLSNINNKFLVTTGGNVLIGQTSAVGSSILQITGTSIFKGIANVIELNQSSTGSATYYVMDNTVETGGKRYRFGYSGGSADKGSFTIYNETDNILPLTLSGANATFSGEISSGDDINCPTKIVLGESASPEVRLKKTDAGTASIRFYSDNTQEAYIMLDAYEHMVYYGAANVGQYFYANTVLNETKTGANSTFAGNVGIQVAPTVPLEVRTASDQHFTVASALSSVALKAHNNGASAYIPMSINGSTLAINADSGGNVGIGIAPYLSSLPNTVIDINPVASIWGYVNSIYLNSNAYYNSGWIYKTTAPAGVLQVDGNLLRFRTAASGTAGAGIGFDVPFLIDTNGNVGIGTTGPSTKLQVNDTVDGNKINISKNDALVGSFGTYNGVPYIGYQGGAGGGIMFNGSSIEPTLLGSARSSGTNDIGSSSYKWRNVYLSGGVNLGGTGVANRLDDYEEGTFYANTNNDGVGNQVLSKYTKIGRLVSYTIYFSGVSHTAAGTAIITGFPFTAIITEGYGQGSVTHSTSVLNCSGGYNAATNWYGTVNNSTAQATWSTGTGKAIMVSGFYYTAA